jgi:hypothetical protein
MEGRAADKRPKALHWGDDNDRKSGRKFRRVRARAGPQAVALGDAELFRRTYVH